MMIVLERVSERAAGPVEPKVAVYGDGKQGGVL